ncbi:hypothetical protein BC629DRAFT_1288186, partial [Irpex lacteus]
MTGGISGYLRQEFRELELLDEITKLRHNSKLPSNVGGSTRNQLISSYRLVKGKHYIPKFMPNALKWNQYGFEIEDIINETEWHVIDRTKPKLVSDDTNRKACTKDKLPPNYIPAKGSQQLDKVSVMKPERITGKRRHDNTISSTILQENKKLKVVSNIERNIIQSPKGFIWNNNTFSCAFDSLFTILLHNLNENLRIWNS